MPVHRYELRFGREGGCPLTVVQDMARHDRATVLSVGSDLKCEASHVRAALLLGDQPPTMARWASFAVGASVRMIASTAASPLDRYVTGEAAMVPRGPRA